MINQKSIAYIRAHIRLAWRYYDEERRKCLKTIKCNLCGKRDRLYADHKYPVGHFDWRSATDYLTRMFVLAHDLQAICKKCHDLKTANERKRGDY